MEEDQRLQLRDHLRLDPTQVFRKQVVAWQRAPLTLVIAQFESRGPIWILDSSAAINFKTLPIDRQWEFGDILLDLIGRGELLFPSQVHRELTDPQLIRHPDMPGAWAARAWRLMKPHPTPKDMTVREVLRAHPDIIDVNAHTPSCPM